MTQIEEPNPGSRQVKVPALEVISRRVIFIKIERYLNALKRSFIGAL